VVDIFTIIREFGPSSWVGSVPWLG